MGLIHLERQSAARPAGQGPGFVLADRNFIGHRRFTGQGQGKGVLPWCYIYKWDALHRGLAGVLHFYLDFFLVNIEDDLAVREVAEINPGLTRRRENPVFFGCGNHFDGQVDVGAAGAVFGQP